MRRHLGSVLVQFLMATQRLLRLLVFERRQLRRNAERVGHIHRAYRFKYILMMD